MESKKPNEGQVLNRSLLARKWLGMEIKEIKPTLLRFFYLFFLMVSFIAAKSLRDATFLNTYGAVSLPIIYLLLTLTVAISAIFYNRLTEKFSCKMLFFSSLGGMLFLQLVFFVLYLSAWSWVPFVFYFFVASYGILISQFWLFLGQSYDIRQARRLMVVIGAGGILGALAGGFMVRWVTSLFPVHFLLLVSCGSVGVCFGIYRFLWQGLCPHKTVERAPLRISEAIPIFKSRYLRKIFAILSLAAITAIFVEYQFNVFVEKNYQTTAEMASFFGVFYLILSVAALLIQFFITRIFMKKAGLIAALVLLPIGLFAGGLALIILPALGVALITRLWDGSIRHSLYRTATELIYLPLSEVEKIRSKILLDTFVPKVAEGFAGLLLLVGTRVFHLPQMVFSAAVVFFSFLGVTISLSLRKEYAEKLKENLEGGRNELAVVRIDFSDQTTLSTVAHYLNSSDPFKVVNTIRILNNFDHPELLPDELLLHTDDQVKIEMIRTFNETGRVPPEEYLHRLFNYDDPEIAVEIMRLHSRYYPEGVEEELCSLLHSDRPVIRAVAAEMPACRQNLALSNQAYDTIRSMAEALDDGAVSERISAAWAIGNIARPRYTKLLLRLLDDNNPHVVRASIQAASKGHYLHAVFHLLEMLRDARFRSDATSALTGYGGRIVGTLYDFLRDPSADFRVRIQIPDVLAGIGGSQTLDILQACLNDNFPMIRRRLLRAIRRMIRRDPSLKIDKPKLLDCANAEVQSCFCLILYHETLILYGLKEEMLIMRSLREKIDLVQEAAFRCLDLLYPEAGFFRTHWSLRSNMPNARAWAKELVDTVIKKPDILREGLLKLVDRRPILDQADNGRPCFSLEHQSGEKVLEDLCLYPDHWLASCALYCLGELAMYDLFVTVTKQVDPNSVRIKDTIAFVERKFLPGGNTDAFYYRENT